MNLRKSRLSFLLASVLLSLFAAGAAPAEVIKIATTAPDGTA